MGAVGKLGHLLGHSVATVALASVIGIRRLDLGGHGGAGCGGTLLQTPLPCSVWDGVALAVPPYLPASTKSNGYSVRSDRSGGSWGCAWMYNMDGAMTG
jgi:hypothetical protein